MYTYYCHNMLLFQFPKTKKLCAFCTNGVPAEDKVSCSKQHKKIRYHHESETHLDWCNKQHSSYPDQLPP